MRPTHAQTTAPVHVYYQISFMKSRPGQDPLKMERELWKPIHKARLEGGQINSWSVMEPIYSGPHPYEVWAIVESVSK